MEEKYLIVGLGNPGLRYKNTLHNMGFQVVEYLAKKQKASFKKDKACKGLLTSFTQEGKRVFLLMPQTYMNESGTSVAKALRYFEVPLQHLLVIVDDVALDFGVLRLRESGSAGGHNGLKNIQQHLSTEEYARLRVGVGEKQDDRRDLSTHVLSRFTKEQKQQLPELFKQAEQGIITWLFEGIKIAMNQINVRKKQNEEADKE